MERDLCIHESFTRPYSSCKSLVMAKDIKDDLDEVYLICATFAIHTARLSRRLYFRFRLHIHKNWRFQRRSY